MTKISTGLFLFIFVISVVFVIYFIFSGRLILPQSFSLGPLSIHYYGIIMALAVAGGFYLAIRSAKNYQFSQKQAEDIIFWTIVGGFIGSRLYHVLSSFGYYWQHPVDIIKVWNGGLSIYGAVLGGLISLFIALKILNHKSSILNYLDWLTPSLILGQILGRFGNLFNYELYGYGTNLPWKMFVPAQFRPEQYQFYDFFHPLFLYEVLGCVIIFAVLMKLSKPCQPLRDSIPPKGKEAVFIHSFSLVGKPGALFFSYILLYNLLRFALEFLRIDAVFIGQIRQNAVISLMLVAASAFWLIKHRNAKIS